MHLPDMRIYNQMHRFYDTIWLNASTIYANVRSNAPTMYPNVWSNAPIIWYYTVECIYHICKCMIECTYNTILYGQMHLSYATIQVNASITWDYMVECIYHMWQYGWMHLFKHIIIMPHGFLVFTRYHMLFKYTRKFQGGFYVVV